jgi:AraC family transcriptional activator FtrA
MKPHLVAALAYEGLCTFEFGCVVELFALPRPELPVPWYEFAVCAEKKGAVRALGGVSVAVPHSLQLLDRADTIVIPGWRDTHEVPPASLTCRLRRAHERGARLCSICSGVFVLAAAGLLEGRRATTHWRYAQTLARMYPQVEVLPDALYVDEGDIVTSAGSAAGLDMLIHLVRRDHGAGIANQVARRLVIPPHRQGGQSQFVARPVPRDERGRLARLQDWLRRNLHAVHTIDSMAARAATSARTLQREFKQATGESAFAWLLRERIRYAQELLENSQLPLSAVAERAGVRSMESFRHHFRRQVGTTPSLYRSRFAASRPSGVRR